jgi:hypothetical protein
MTLVRIRPRGAFQQLVWRRPDVFKRFADSRQISHSYTRLKPRITDRDASACVGADSGKYVKAFETIVLAIEQSDKRWQMALR